jgi:hypothetical protein
LAAVPAFDEKPSRKHPMPDIFISYRREDTIAYAGRIYDRLTGHFGKEHVFMDVDTIELGMDFVEILQKRVGLCDVLLAVIGRRWLTIADEAGERRLDNPEDLVRLEIAAALDRKIRVIPILVSGARMPRSNELPHQLESLARRQALEIVDTAFHQSVSLLINALEGAERPFKKKARELLEPEAKAKGGVLPGPLQRSAHHQCQKCGATVGEGIIYCFECRQA